MAQLRAQPGFRIAVALVAVLAINLLALAGWWVLNTLDAGVLGVGMVAYLLGMRHAFDADHIAAIDNVTRRLLAVGQRPAGIGLFFSLGHSSVVLVMVAAVAVATRRAGTLLPQLSAWGAVFGTLVSASFLTLVGLVNLRFLISLLNGNTARQPGGLAIRVTARVVDQSWKMFPIGMLFGLGFDTASEVALLALSVAAARGSAPLCGVMLLPLQFAAGMALMDTLESLLMLRAYVWAIRDRNRTLRLNTLITSLSVFLALAVATDEWLGLFSQRFAAATVPGLDSSAVGILVTAGLLGLWMVAGVRRRRQCLPVTAELQ